MSEKLSEQFAMIDLALNETLRPHAVERMALRSIQAKLETMREVLRITIAECESPARRNAHTQRQQVNFLDGLRAKLLAAAQEAEPGPVEQG
jgi:hypothetical protein